jgi:Na+/H+ antiporter NhaA
MALIFLPPFAGQYSYWGLLKAAVPESKEPGKALSVIVVGSFLIPALGSAPFILWSLGTIQEYSIAMALSISFTVGVLVITGNRILKHADSFTETFT